MKRPRENAASAPSDFGEQQLGLGIFSRRINKSWQKIQTEPGGRIEDQADHSDHGLERNLRLHRDHHKSISNGAYHDGPHSKPPK
ncbi:hypothetical protein PSHT_05824 [Puccinia striiformis]|uniref:Uncharacterized protein n=1 Tax=Puccinia striiformis TaxID=27350 RepID=A0A2S4W9I9_9BASI|nr:hypothetical protein PSHT_05824 [Puccinia striiformis]